MYTQEHFFACTLLVFTRVTLASHDPWEVRKSHLHFIGRKQGKRRIYSWSQSQSVSELGLELRSSWFPVLCLVYYITLCLCLLLIFSASVFPWTPGTASTHSPTYWSSSSLQNNLWPTPLESPQSQSVPCNEIFFPFPLLRRLSYFHANFLPLTDTGS